MIEYVWNETRNTSLVLSKDRAIGFEEVIKAIESGGLIDDLEHINSDKYPNQRMYIVNIRQHIYVVPYVKHENKIFLKTIYPSRKFTAIYLEGGKNG